MTIVKAKYSIIQAYPKQATVSLLQKIQVSDFGSLRYQSTFGGVDKSYKRVKGIVKITTLFLLRNMYMRILDRTWLAYSSFRQNPTVYAV